jgi:hypothetical protein
MKNSIKAGNRVNNSKQADRKRCARIGPAARVVNKGIENKVTRTTWGHNDQSYHGADEEEEMAQASD